VDSRVGYGTTFHLRLPLADTTHAVVAEPMAGPDEALNPELPSAQKVEV
jgi:hypothetical protein